MMKKRTLRIPVALGFRILVLCAVLSLSWSSISSQNLQQSAKVVAPDRAADAGLGFSVAISGNFAVVGARWEDTDQFGASPMTNAGAAYIYQRDANGQWAFYQKIAAADRDDNAEFGYDVDIHDEVIVVGARYESYDALGNNFLTRAGAVYVFELNQFGVWAQFQKIVPTDRWENEWFGTSIAVDSSFIAVGCPGDDHLDNFANPVFNGGALFTFRRGSSSWFQTDKFENPSQDDDDYFGTGVAMSFPRVLCGAPDADPVNVNNAGQVYLYAFSGNSFNYAGSYIAPDRAPNDNFGLQVAISDSAFLVGAPFNDFGLTGAPPVSNAGAAYLFRMMPNGSYNFAQKLVAPDRQTDDRFGQKVALDDSMAVVGSKDNGTDGQGNNPILRAGSAVAYSLDVSGTWSLLGKLTAPIRDSLFYFGSDVAVEGEQILVGSYGDELDENGANPFLRAGAAYFFENSCNTAFSIQVTACESYHSPTGKLLTASGIYQDTLQNAANCDSILSIDLTILPPSATSINPSACESYLSPAGNTYTSSGLYLDTLQNQFGCDSVISIDLTIQSLQAAAMLNGNTLSANPAGADYQWYECVNGVPNLLISGATGQDFSPTSSGDYAVVVDDDICTDTSACLSFTLVGVEIGKAHQMQLFPNPSTGKVQVNHTGINEAARIEVFNALGTQLARFSQQPLPANLDLSHLAKGLYFIQVQTENGTQHRRLILE